MTLGIMPVAGLPLPFVSYGGSSMFAVWVAVGLLQSIRVPAPHVGVGLRWLGGRGCVFGCGPVGVGRAVPRATEGHGRPVFEGRVRSRPRHLARPAWRTRPFSPYPTPPRPSHPPGLRRQARVGCGGGAPPGSKGRRLPMGCRGGAPRGVRGRSPRRVLKGQTLGMMRVPLLERSRGLGRVGAAGARSGRSRRSWKGLVLPSGPTATRFEFMADTKREIERKYEGPPAEGDASLPDLTDVPGVSVVIDKGVAELDATYYDTADQRLATASLTLRRRTGGDDAGWHLKLPVSEGVRDEIRAPLSDTVPEDLTALVRSRIREAELVPIVRLLSVRHPPPRRRLRHPPGRGQRRPRPRGAPQRRCGQRGIDRDRGGTRRRRRSGVPRQGREEAPQGGHQTLRLRVQTGQGPRRHGPPQAGEAGEGRQGRQDGEGGEGGRAGEG